VHTGIKQARAPVRAGGEKVKMIQAVVVLLPGHAKILHRLALRAIAHLKVQRLRHPRRLLRR
jgi:hypothetical protein